MANKKDPEKEYSPNWGGARAGGGRRRKGEGGRVAFQVSCTAEQRQRIRRLAAEAGLSVSEFIVQKATS